MMHEKTEALELELNPELSQNPESSLYLVVSVILDGMVGAQRESQGPSFRFFSEQVAPQVSTKWPVGAHLCTQSAIKFLSPRKGEGWQHGIEGHLESPGEEKVQIFSVSVGRSAFERLREAASKADVPADPPAERPERRGLSMDEILAEVERGREEKGAPVAERLLGVPAHKRHAAVLEGLPYQAFEDVRHALGVSSGDLARVIGSSERTMRRRKESGALKQQESDALVRVAAAFERATRALGEARAVRWLTSPHPLLGGERALDLLSTSAGAEIVDEMLGAIEHGMPV